MKRFSILLFSLLAIIPQMICAKDNGKASALYAGAAKADITPPASIFPIQPLHEAYPYVDAHDTLYARALVLDNKQQRTVIVELDEVAVPDADRLIKEVAEAAKVSAQNVMVCVSHTHSTLHPSGEDPRLSGVIDKIRQGSVAAVKQAVARLEPAYVSFGRTRAYVNINNGEIEQSKGQYSTTAFSDKTLDLLKLTRHDGSMLALIVNYPTHAEMMFRSVSGQGGYEVSGDLPGRVANILETDYENAVVLTTAGAEGDQQPIFTSRQHTSTQGYVDEGACGWGLVDALARRLVDAVKEKVEVMPQGTNSVLMTVNSSEAVVPGQHRHQMRETGKIIDEPAEDVHIPLIRIRLNDIALDGVGADLASSIGVAVRQASTVENTMLITNTAKAVGYVLPDEEYKHYTHGVFGSSIRPGYAQNAIIEAFKKIEVKP